MGVLKGLVTVPLAPVRGVIWLAERIADQVERETDDQVAISRRLADLRMAWDRGELSEDEYRVAEADLVDRLMEGYVRRAGP